MKFDLGYEVFVLPVLWGVLILTVFVLIILAFEKVQVEGTDDLPEYRRTLNKRALAKAGIVFVVGGLVLASLVVVPPGHRGAIYTTAGVSLEERGEGYSFMIPVVNNANMVNVREQKYENLKVYAQTYDGLEVTAQIGVNYTIQPDKAADIFQSVGQGYAKTIIEPAVLGLVKREIGLVIAEQLFYQRGSVETAIFESLTDRLDPVGITVTFVALQDTIFSPDIVREFLQKEAARQQVVTREREDEAAEHEANRQAELARGQAEATERLAEAVNYERELLGMTPEQYIWFKTWNGVVPQILGGGSGFDFILNPSDLSQSQPEEEPETTTTTDVPPGAGAAGE